MSTLDRQTVAENDRTYAENTRAVNRRFAAGKVTAQQADHIRIWLMQSAVRRFQRKAFTSNERGAR